MALSVTLLVVRPFLESSEVLELALDRLFDDPRRVRVALDQHLGHLLGLLEADVRGGKGGTSGSVTAS